MITAVMYGLFCIIIVIITIVIETSSSHIIIVVVVAGDKLHHYRSSVAWRLKQKEKHKNEEHTDLQNIVKSELCLIFQAHSETESSEVGIICHRDKLINIFTSGRVHRGSRPSSLPWGWLWEITAITAWILSWKRVFSLKVCDSK